MNKYIDPAETKANVKIVMSNMRTDILKIIKKYFSDDMESHQIEALIDDQLDKICKIWVNATLYKD